MSALIEKLSSYELLRLKNLEDNRKMMRSLGLFDDTIDETGTNSSRSKPKRRYRKSPLPPTRQKSLRIKDRRERRILKIDKSLPTQRKKRDLPKENELYKEHQQNNIDNYKEEETEPLDIDLHLATDTKQNNRRCLDKKRSTSKKRITPLTKKRQIVRPNCYCCDPDS